jgi:hypothetical protein
MGGGTRGAKRVGRAFGRLAYGEPTVVSAGQFAVRADVVGALLGLAVAVGLVVLAV